MYSDSVMQMAFRKDFSGYTDRQLVDMVVNEGLEEAIYYLVYQRYYNDMAYLCVQFYRTPDMVDDLLGFLMLKLKGSSQDWRALRQFGWRSSFRTWLSTVASNLFLEKRKELIGLGDATVSIDIDDDGRPNIQVPSAPANDERSQNVVILMEAISRLGNPLQRFVLVKELEGYSPKEIAEMLNSSQAESDAKALVITPAYVYNVKHRAIDSIKKIVEQIKYEWYGDK